MMPEKVKDPIPHDASHADDGGLAGNPDMFRMFLILAVTLIVIYQVSDFIIDRFKVSSFFEFLNFYIDTYIKIR